VFLRFYAAESTETNMAHLKAYIERYGRPRAFYGDKASHFRVTRSATVQEQLGLKLTSQKGPVEVLVDYAHTPAGLDGALRAVRTLAGDGRVVCLFGCGGDRDTGKRPEMGAVATGLADVVVLTSDNPRSEDPAAIIDQVRSGMDGPAEVVVEPDRATAVRVAVGLARPGDVVLLAGKGHETTQTSGGATVPFDDRVAAAEALAVRFGRDGGTDG